MDAKYRLAISILLAFVVLTPTLVVAAPSEKLDSSENINDELNKVITAQNPTSTDKSIETIPSIVSSEEDTQDAQEKSSSTSTAALIVEQPPAPLPDLERSHSDVVESKVSKQNAAESVKDEKLGTADSFGIGFGSPNALGFDAPLISGAYGPLPPGGIGPYPEYLGVQGQGQGFQNDHYYGGQGGGFVGNPLYGGYGGVTYGGYGNYPNLYKQGGVGIGQQQLFINKQREFGVGPYGVREGIQKSIKQIDTGFGGHNPYGGYGAGIDDYSRFGGLGYQQQGIGLGKQFGGSQYPINLNAGGFQPYLNGGYGLEAYKQQQLLAAGGFGGIGQKGFIGGGYNNGYLDDNILARRKAGLDPYYNNQFNPGYGQEEGGGGFNSFQQRNVENKYLPGKSPYGFYRNT